MNTQENIFQTMDSSDTSSNKTKIYHLLNKGFKIAVLKGLTKVTIIILWQVDRTLARLTTNRKDSNK